MKIDIQKALKYPFDDPKWPMKVGVLVAIAVFLGALQEGVNLYTNSLDFIPQGEETLNPFIALFLIGGFGFVLASGLVQFVFQLYTGGYYLENTKNVMKGRKLPLPDLGNLTEKFKLSLGMLVIVLVPMILLILTSSLLWIPAALVLFTAQGSPFTILIVGISAFALMSLGILLFLFALFVVIPTFQYIYIKNRSITEAWSYTNFKKVASAGWQRFTIVNLVGLGLGFAALLIGFMTCFLFWLVGPALLVWAQLANSQMMGEVFAELNKEKVLK